MPNLSAHLAIAREAARCLNHPTADRHLGSFLLGCTAPDIRIITRWSREETHFSPLSTETIGEGVRLMFQRHPHLADPSRLSEPTRAFVLGYISHLVADEAWIILLYRPFFGNRDVFADHRQGNLMDRALQLELDRRAFEDLKGVQEVQECLANAVDNVNVDFISPETLVQWRDWVLAATQRGFTWERLRSMARRAYPPDDPDATEAVEEFLGDALRGVSQIFHRVPVEEVQRFRHETIFEFLRIAREYLP